MEAFVEVRVRAFFTSEEADLAPATIALVRIGGGQPPDWNKAIGASIQEVLSFDDLPMTNVRPMTREEVDQYREDEDGDAS